MDTLLKILLAACVCYSTVDGRRSNATRLPPDQQAADASTCEFSVVITCVMSKVAALRPLPPILGLPYEWYVISLVSSELGKHNITDACRIVTEFRRCAMDVLDTRCTVSARDEFMNKLTSRDELVTIGHVLQYVCIGHIEAFEELLECVKRNEKQGVDLKKITASRCPAFVRALTRKSCSARSKLNCPIDVITTFCGQAAADALRGAVRMLFRRFWLPRCRSPRS